MNAENFLEADYFYIILDLKSTALNLSDITNAMEAYTKLKCEELLRIIAEKALLKNKLDAYQILGAVDLNSFIK